jgi:hypothetical protein
MRRALPGLAFLVAVLLGSSSAFAAPRPMAWSQLQRQIQQPVEQQTPGGATQPDRSLWVTNPTPCAWDPDDRIDGLFSGVIGKGETVSHTECVILDKANHLAGLKVGDGLAGSIRVSQPAGDTFAGSTFDERCLLTPEYGDPEYLALPEIDGSNGGHGDRVTVTWTITNVSGHRLGKAIAITVLQLDTGQARVEWGC